MHHFAKCCRQNPSTSGSCGGGRGGRRGSGRAAAMFTKKSPGGRRYILTTLNNLEMSFLVDSGADVSAISKQRALAAHTRYRSKKPGEFIHGAGGEKLSVIGILKTNLKLGDQQVPVTLKVVPELRDGAILGTDTFSQFKSLQIEFGGPLQTLTLANLQDPTEENPVDPQDKLQTVHKPSVFRGTEGYRASTSAFSTIDSPGVPTPASSLVDPQVLQEQPSTLQLKEHYKKLLSSHAKIFDQTHVRFKVKPRDEVLRVRGRPKPIVASSRPRPPQDKTFIEQEVERMFKEDLIEDATDSPWRSQPVVVRAASGKMRMAIDYSQTINRFTELDPYPLPLTEELLREVAQYKVFSSVDLRSSFHLLELPMGERAYTAFEGSRKHPLCQFKVLPFGVTNGSAAFMRAINEILEPLNGITAFIDDIVIGGKN